jgi:hypothetical protein
MKRNTRIRTLAGFGASALVLAGAVHLAAANVSTARDAAKLVGGDQRIIRIMVTPDLANNDIKLSTPNKAVDVAIIYEQTWNFSDIEPTSVEFNKAIPARNSFKTKDVDNDGEGDRIYTFTTKDLKLTETDTIACLTAETIQRQKLRGCDRIKVIKGAPAP